MRIVVEAENVRRACCEFVTQQHDCASAELLERGRWVAEKVDQDRAKLENVRALDLARSHSPSEVSDVR